MSVSLHISGSPQVVRRQWTITTIQNQTPVPIVISAGALGVQTYFEGNGFATFCLDIGPFQTTTASVVIDMQLPTGITGAFVEAGRMGVGGYALLVLGAAVEPCLSLIYNVASTFPFCEFVRCNYPAAGVLQAGVFGGAAFPINTNIRLLANFSFPTR